MHKDFYASGFIFHSPSQQILLQQPTDSSSHWSLFSGEKKSEKDPKEVFERVIFELFHRKIMPQNIFPVYDYTHSTSGRPHFIFYAEVKNSQEDFTSKEDILVQWFTFKQLYKLPLSEQTKQDITVGQRVLNASFRELEVQRENNLVNKG